MLTMYTCAHQTHTAYDGLWPSIILQQEKDYIKLGCATKDAIVRATLSLQQDIITKHYNDLDLIEKSQQIIIS